MAKLLVLTITSTAFPLFINCANSQPVMHVVSLGVLVWGAGAVARNLVAGEIEVFVPVPKMGDKDGREIPV